MEPLKNAYSLSFFNLFLEDLEKVAPSIDKIAFIKAIFTVKWDSYELKQRTHHIATILHNHLDKDFTKALEQIKELIPYLLKSHGSGGYEHLFIPDYVETYGLDYVEESVNSFETITPFVSCEFAIRPFLINHTEFVLSKMTEWSFHPNKHLRRLASEGCRPRLPWAMSIPAFKEDPSPILPLLTNLFNDEHLYVRKSVGNNLNDISKDNPEVIIELTKKHYGKTSKTDWILKKANRTLLKQAEPNTMEIFGFGQTQYIDIQNLELKNTDLHLGDYLVFSFDLVNKSKKPALVRLEYAVYYLKKNQKHSKKIFKISEKVYPSFSINNIFRKQHFKSISTRKYHFGEHKIALVVNGKEFDIHTFQLNP